MPTPEFVVHATVPSFIRLNLPLVFVVARQLFYKTLTRVQLIQPVIL